MMAHARPSCFSWMPHNIPSSGRRNSPPAGRLCSSQARRTAGRNSPPAGRLCSSQARRTASIMADGRPDLLQAAKYTVDNYVKNGMVVGLGGGRASALAIQYMGRQIREGALQDIVGVPISLSSASEATKAGIPLNNYQKSIQIDFVFDDADIVEEGTLTAIIGRGKLDAGKSVIQEKSVVETAGSLAFILSENQYLRVIEGSIPVLVNPGNWMETAEEIDDLFLGDAEIWRRPVSGHTGPSGGDFPFVTAEGHHILDVIFTTPILDLAQVAESLDQINGVVNHGIITGIPCTAIIASKNGVMTQNNLSKIRI